MAPDRSIEEKSPQGLYLHVQINRDRPYVTEVAHTILRQYDGQGPQWKIPAGVPLWDLSLGGRAGVVGVSIDNRICCGKLFYDARLRNRLRTWLGQAKARRAYQHAQHLTELGIRCPRPLGYVEQRPWGPALLLTELISDAPRLQDWLSQYPASPALMFSLASFLRHMHDQGVTHRDLSPRNLLVGGTLQIPEFYLLDYEDTRFHAHVTESQRLDDLHHLDERLLQTLSPRQRLSALRSYAGKNYLAWRKLLNERLEHSQSKYVRAYRLHSQQTKK